MLKIKGTEKVKNEEVLQRTKPKKKILNIIVRKSKYDKTQFKTPKEATINTRRNGLRKKLKKKIKNKVMNS